MTLLYEKREFYEKKKQGVSDTHERMLYSHVLGSVKNVMYHVCVCWLHLCQHQLWSSQGLPCQHTFHTTVSGLPELQCLRHAVASDTDPVTDSQMTLFPSPFINTAPRAFFDNKTMCSRAVERSGGAWGRRTWMLNLLNSCSMCVIKTCTHWHWQCSKKRNRFGLGLSCTHHWTV